MPNKIQKIINYCNNQDSCFKCKFYQGEPSIIESTCLLEDNNDRLPFDDGWNSNQFLIYLINNNEK